MHTIPRSAFQLKSNQQRFKQPLKLKVQATQHGYFYTFRSLTGQLVCGHVGLLPTDYLFDKASAELFALCEAARRLYSDEELRGYRVAIVCSSLPLSYNRPVQRRAA
jgi:hypothetical protein